jgi:hypothetical protein
MEGEYREADLSKTLLLLILLVVEVLAGFKIRCWRCLLLLGDLQRKAGNGSSGKRRRRFVVMMQ